MKLQEHLDSFAQRPNLRLALKSFSYFFSEKVTRVLVGFILQTWLARHLGPENMGIYSYVADFVGIFIPIILFGFDDILVKDLVRTDEPGKIIGTVFYFRLALSAVTWIGLCVSIWIIRREAPEIVIYTILYGLLLFVRSFDTFLAYFHAKYLIRSLVRGRQTAYAIVSLARGFGLWMKFGIVYFMINTFLQNVLEKAFIYWELRKAAKFELKFDLTYLKSNIPHALPIAITSFFVYAETRMGTFFISRYGTLEDVGVFGVGRGLIDLWEFIPMTICLTVFPIVIKMKDTKPEIYDSKLRKLYGGLFYLALCFAFGVAFSSPYIVKHLYGPAFQETAKVMSFGAFLTILTYLNLARVKWYILENRTSVWMKLCILSFILNFAFQFYFTKEFILIGPYISALISQLISNSLMCLFSRSVREDLGHVLSGVFLPFNLLFAKGDK